MSKLEIGDKVRVRSDLVVDRRYGNDYLFNSSMSSKVGLETTVVEVVDNEYYLLKDISWHWTDEMLEPVETFNVGDVVYAKDRKRPMILLRKAWVVCPPDKTSYEYFVEERDLSKTKPLEKITREELAEKGYELVD